MSVEERGTDAPHEARLLLVVGAEPLDPRLDGDRVAPADAEVTSTCPTTVLTARGMSFAAIYRVAPAAGGAVRSPWTFFTR